MITIIAIVQHQTEFHSRTKHQMISERSYVHERENVSSTRRKTVEAFKATHSFKHWIALVPAQKNARQNRYNLDENEHNRNKSILSKDALRSGPMECFKSFSVRDREKENYEKKKRFL